MYWIALQASPDEDGTAWGWRALQFTPRVATVDEAILLEAGASERLFGGRKRLLRGLLKEGCELKFDAWASGATSLAALSLLRMKRAGQELPANVPDELPLATFSAAAPHLPTLERIGCTTIGQLRQLPRAGLGRRFGPELLHALDAVDGQRPERYAWLTLPSSFDQKLELPALATSAADLLFTGQHLLSRLQSWLQARNLGVLAIELEWTLDLRRLDGKPLPPTEKIDVRTAQPTQDTKHLRRLASEQLARTALAAPANALRLRTLETVPWGGVSTSLLPEDNKPGERLYQFIERLSVRLGDGNVVFAHALQDHRPECMQEWLPARSATIRHSRAGGNPGLPQSAPAARPWIPACAGMTEKAAGMTEKAAGMTDQAEALYPPWLLREPLKLQVKADKPCYQGPLQLLTRARRIEAAWWDTAAQEPALRDYFIARSASAGLLWVFRERLAADQPGAQWYLHGLFA